MTMNVLTIFPFPKAANQANPIRGSGIYDVAEQII